MAGLLIFSGVIQTLILIVFLWRTKRGHESANQMLCVYLALIAYYLVVPEIIRNSQAEWKVHLIATSFPMLFLIGPFLLAYTQLVLASEIHLSRKFLLHFVPACLALLGFIPFYIKSGDEKNAIFESFRTLGMPISFTIAWNLACVHIILYLGIILVKTRRYHTLLKQCYSNLERINLKWLEKFTFGNVVIWVLYFIGYILITLKIEIDPLGIIDQTFSILVSLLIFLMAYAAMEKPELFPGPVVPDDDVITVSRVTLSDSKRSDYQVRLEKVIQEQRPYLNPELSLQMLAVMTGIQSRELSQLLQACYSKNFYDYINMHRVKEFKSRIEKGDHKHLTIVGIARDCGFSSKSTFYETFKRFEGFTPSAYKKMIQTTR